MKCGVIGVLSQGNIGNVTYLPYKVIRSHKSTTKLRILFDASDK